MTAAIDTMITRNFSTTTPSVASAFLGGNVVSRRLHEKMGFEASGRTKASSQVLVYDVLRRDLILHDKTKKARQ